MFSRRRRGKGWEYHLVLNPEAFVSGRKAYSDTFQAIRSAIAGESRNGRHRIGLRKQHEIRAAVLRERKVELDREQILESIDKATWMKRKKELDREIESLARELTFQYRQDLPRKHREA
jgi:hypothetical protein